MACVKCGEVCCCPMEPPPTDLPNSDESPHAEAIVVTESDGMPGDSGNTEWREELSARLNRYRSRRKAQPPRYPSLRLPFEASNPARPNPAIASSSTSAPNELARGGNPPVFEASSNHALALNALPHEPAPPAERKREPVVPRPGTTAGAKIIEFPRFAWGPPPPPLDQLAEPVMDRPRILEVPEVAPPPPALGGITIEPAPVQEPEKRPGIDIPLQSAPLGRRLAAGVVDGLIIGAASTLFGYIFWKVAGVCPPRFQLLALAAGISCLFWASYQYLLIIYSGRTPGLMAARLELKRFDGTLTNRSLRRWRVLASWLSAASIGMGYAWLFLDEDALCWHDRITRTYLAPRGFVSKN
jgi:hypothetical protein